MEGVLDCISFDRFTFLSSDPVAEPEDEEVGETGVVVGESVEGWLLMMLGAERSPEAEELGLGVTSLLTRGCGGDFERSAEISCEANAGGRCRSTQGLSCG